MGDGPIGELSEIREVLGVVQCSTLVFVRTTVVSLFITFYRVAGEKGPARWICFLFTLPKEAGPTRHKLF